MKDPDLLADHLATVRHIYEAFSKGDVAAIFDVLADDVRWEHWTTQSERATAPWLQPRSDKAGVAEFFRIVATFEVREFTVRSIMANENQVVAEIVMDAAVPGGGQFRDEELHLWTFDEAGKICAMRHYVDTAKHLAAARGEDTTRPR